MEYMKVHKRFPERPTLKMEAVKLAPLVAQTLPASARPTVKLPVVKGRVGHPATDLKNRPCRSLAGATDRLLSILSGARSSREPEDGRC